MKVRIEKRNENSIGIFIDDEGKGFPEITIFRDRDMQQKKISEWKISWSSIGSVDVKTAEKFNSALQKAIEFVNKGGDEKTLL